MAASSRARARARPRAARAARPARPARRQRRTRPALLPWLAALAGPGSGAGPRPARAEVLDLGEVAVPSVASLAAHYRFYVYDEQDAPSADGGPPAVAFDVVLRNATTGGPAALRTPPRLQLIVMPERQFWQQVDTLADCSRAEDAAAAKAPDVRALHGAVRVAVGGERAASTVKLEGPSGVYVLALASCGVDPPSVRLQGSVSVTSAHGHLPAIHAPKGSVFAAIAVFYAGATAAWLVAAARWRRQLYYVQKGIAAIGMLGFVEGLAWWLFYRWWNLEGVSRDLLYGLGAFASAWKVKVGIRAVLRSAILDPHSGSSDDGSETCMVDMLPVFFLLSQFNFRTVLFHRHGYAITLPFLAANAAPALISGVALALWCYRAQGDRIACLRERKQDATASLFASSQAVVVLGAIGGAVVAAAELLDPTADADVHEWRTQWLYSDGAFQESVQGYMYREACTDGDTIGCPQDDDGFLDVAGNGGKVDVADRFKA